MSKRIGWIRMIQKRMDKLERRIEELESRPNFDRTIGPKLGQCGLCGNVPCTCEQSQREFEGFLTIRSEQE